MSTTRPVLGQLRPEVELLLCCARAHLPAEQAARLLGLLQRNLDWGLVLQQAQAHGLGALLFHHLGQLDGELVPEGAHEQLRRQAQDTGLRNLLLTGELLKALELFAANELPALPFKGPTLASLVYGNLALRPFNDLDVLVRSRDANRAQGLLFQRGYLPAGEQGAPEAYYLGELGQLPLERGADGPLFELHTRFLPKAFAFDLALAEVWPRCRTQDILGRAVPCLSPEDLLLLLCAHGAKHLWERLIWACDVAELLRACPELCWSEVQARARRLHGERMLGLGLALAHHFLDAPLPGPVAHLTGTPAVQRLLAGAYQSIARGTERGPWARSLFYVRARERTRDGARYALSLAFSPTPADWSAAPLATRIGWFYYVLRPIRLLATYARQLRW